MDFRKENCSKNTLLVFFLAYSDFCRGSNTDKHKAYPKAISELKKAGELPESLEHRRVKYLNNGIESDHGKLKRLTKPTLGFKTMRTARATIAGFEVMRMFKKGQFKGIKTVHEEAAFITKVLTAC